VHICANPHQPHANNTQGHGSKSNSAQKPEKKKKFFNFYDLFSNFSNRLVDFWPTIAKHTKQLQNPKRMKIMDPIHSPAYIALISETFFANY